jgi:hypothetical protein
VGPQERVLLCSPRATGLRGRARRPRTPLEMYIDLSHRSMKSGNSQVHDADARVTGPWPSWPHPTCTAVGGARTALAWMVAGMVARI